MSDLTLLTLETVGATPVAAPSDRLLLRGLVAVGLVVGFVKLWLALTAPMIWEEAHFLALGRHPAIAYADVPAGWPLIGRLLEALFGPGMTAPRLFGWLLSEATPFAAYALARRISDHRQGLWAALAAILVPAVSLMGTLFYPEIALQLLLLLMLTALVKALRSDRLVWWAATGAAGALGLFIHYRFALAGAGVLIFATATPGGRILWRRQGFWVAGLIAACGLAPSLVYNMKEGWPALGYQLASRPVWRFDLTLAGKFLAQQLALATPAALVAMAVLWRRRLAEAVQGGPESALIACVAAAIFAPYLLLSPFDARILPHWPILGLVPLLPGLVSVWTRFCERAETQRGYILRLVLVWALGPLVFLAALLGAVISETAAAKSSGWTPPRQEDWAPLMPEVNEAMREARSRFGAPALIAASGHVAAVRLEALGRRDRAVFALGEPNDAVTRFGQMRARWGLDGETLQKAHPGAPVVLVLPEPNYLYHLADETAFRAALCRQFSQAKLSRRWSPATARSSVEVFTAIVGGEGTPLGDCPFLPHLYIAQPTTGQGLKAGAPILSYGLAADPKSVRQLEIIWDGRGLGAAAYGGTPATWIPKALAFDPRYPALSFEAHIPGALATSGEHRLALRAALSDGSVLQSPPRSVFVRPPIGPFR
jgi:hypothetical protein